MWNGVVVFFCQQHCECIAQTGHAHAAPPFHTYTHNTTTTYPHSQKVKVVVLLLALHGVHLFVKLLVVLNAANGLYTDV